MYYHQRNQSIATGDRIALFANKTGTKVPESQVQSLLMSMKNSSQIISLLLAETILDASSLHHMHVAVSFLYIIC